MVVSAIVKAKAEAEDGFKLELTIPSFKSDYPVVVDRVPAELAAKLKPGASYTLVLNRQNLKKTRGEKPYDGRFPWQWYWGLEGLATPAEAASEEAKPEPVDERGLQIAWAQSINCAIQTLGPMAGPPVDPDAYLAKVFTLAQRYYPMVLARPQEDAPAAQIGASAPKPAPQGETKTPAAKAGAPMMTIDELVEWANQNGYSVIGPDGTWDKAGTKREMGKVPGVTRAIVEKKLFDALTLLKAEAAKGPVIS